MNNASCFQCYYCKLERYSLCENLIYNNRAYSEFIKILENILKVNTLKIPDNISYKETALTEPLACVVHGINMSNITDGDMVVVNGAGPIGLFWIALAKLKGARVMSTDLSEERLEIDWNFGADYTVNTTIVDDQVEVVKKFTDGGWAVGIAVDATGFPKVWEMAVRIGRKGAIISLFGGCPSGTAMSIDTGLIYYSGLNIIGVYHHSPYYVRKAFKLIENNQINASRFKTSDIPLEKLVDALELMGNQEGIKYNITV